MNASGLAALLGRVLRSVLFGLVIPWSVSLVLILLILGFVWIVGTALPHQYPGSYGYLLAVFTGTWVGLWVLFLMLLHARRAAVVAAVDAVDSRSTHD